jgi:hypothetical protein
MKNYYRLKVEASRQKNVMTNVKIFKELIFISMLPYKYEKAI